MEYTFKSLALRFARGFIAGAVAAMTTIAITFKNWEEVGTVLSVIGLIGLAGGISGGLLALDKYIRADANKK
jgi:hypothetical protein